MNTLQKFEARQLEKLGADKKFTEFGPGDTVKVNVKVLEGTRERIQAYEGVCIARAGSGMNASFTVRKISYGEGVERVFPLFSPRIDSIELIRRGSVRRAKLYYMRGLRGKAARITERVDAQGAEGEDIAQGEAPTSTPKKAKKEKPQTAGKNESQVEAPAEKPAKKKAAE